MSKAAIAYECFTVADCRAVPRLGGGAAAHSLEAGLRLPGAVVGLPAVPLVIFALRHAANLLWLKTFFAVAADARGPVHGRYAPEP
jgi:hypothetical protein